MTPTCPRTGKCAYTKRDARAMRNLRTSGHRAEPYLRVYPCPYGNHWHLTSKRR